MRLVLLATTPILLPIHSFDKLAVWRARPFVRIHRVFADASLRQRKHEQRAAAGEGFGFRPDLWEEAGYG